jgi:hypothetical protein
MSESSGADSDPEFDYSDEKWTDLKTYGRYQRVLLKGLIREKEMFLPDYIFDYISDSDSDSDSANYYVNDDDTLLIARYTLDTIKFDNGTPTENVSYTIFVNVCDLDHYEKHGEKYNLLKQGICPPRYNARNLYYNEPLFNYTPSDLDFIECHGDKCRLSGENGVWCKSCRMDFELYHIDRLMCKNVLFSDIPSSSIIYIEKSCSSINLENTSTRRKVHDVLETSYNEILQLRTTILEKEEELQCRLAYHGMDITTMSEKLRNLNEKNSTTT